MLPRAAGTPRRTPRRSRQGSRDRDGRCHLRRRGHARGRGALVPKGRSPCDPSNRKIDGEQSLQKRDNCAIYKWAYERRDLRPEVPLAKQAPWSDNPNSDPSTSKGSSLSRSRTRPGRREIRVGQLRSRDPPREAWRRGRSCSVGGKEWPLMTKPADIPGAADGADALCHPAVSMRALCANCRRFDNEGVTSFRTNVTGHLRCAHKARARAGRSTVKG